MKFILFSLMGCLSVLPAIAGDMHIVVTKGARTLEVYQDAQRMHLFRIGLGSSPEGDKMHAGDGKTPEGVFYVCVKNPKSRYYLSLGLSYPDEGDAKRGFGDGLITQQEHDAILAAIAARKTPPWNTALGGEIFIHGKGAASDWTLGCVALEDPDMKTLFELIEVGTKVEIKP